MLADVTAVSMAVEPLPGTQKAVITLTVKNTSELSNRVGPDTYTHRPMLGIRVFDSAGHQVFDAAEATGTVATEVVMAPGQTRSLTATFIAGSPGVYRAVPYGILAAMKFPDSHDVTFGIR